MKLLSWSREKIAVLSKSKLFNIVNHACAVKYGFVMKQEWFITFVILLHLNRKLNMLFIFHKQTAFKLSLVPLKIVCRHRLKITEVELTTSKMKRTSRFEKLSSYFCKVSFVRAKHLTTTMRALLSRRVFYFFSKVEN